MLNPQPKNHIISALEKKLEKLRGNKGTLTLRGDELDVTQLEDITRSAAASGNNAGAEMTFRENDKSQWKKLNDGPSVLDEDEGFVLGDKLGFMEKIRLYYENIRRSGGIL